jgi:opacity protein-like surface antigen
MYGGSSDVSTTNIYGLNKISLNTSVSFGLTGGVNFGPVGLEFLWNHQPTQAVASQAGGFVPLKNIDVSSNQYHGNFLFHFTDAEHKFRPYALIGFGATNASGSGSQVTGGGSSVTKFSYGIGGGVKYFFNESWGIRAQARYAPTYLYTSAGGLWCNWWGYCWVVGNDHYLNQGDFTVGLTWRFGH